MLIPRSSLFLHSFLLLAFSLGAYANTLIHSFVLWDDNWLIYQNRWVTSNSFYSLFQIFSPWTDRTDLGSEYLPLPQLSYFLEYLFWGVNPIGYHLTQILLFSLCCLLLYYLIRTLDSSAVAFWTAALFAAHPIHTESVTWLSSRKDLLGLFFFLGTLLAHQKKCFKWALILLVAALLSKGTTVILIGCILLWDYLQQKNVFQQWRSYSLYFIATLLLVSLHVWVAHSHSNIQPETPDFIETLSTFGVCGVLYFKLLWFPIPLLALYQLHNVPQFYGLGLAFFFMGGTLLYSLICFFRQKHSVAAFFWLWFWGSLLPVSNLIFYRTSAFFAERYLLIASIAFCYIVAKKCHRHLFLLGLIFSCFFLLTINRNQEWQNTEILWKETLKISPKNATVLGNLGMYYQETALKEKSNIIAAEKREKAKKLYLKCLQYEPKHVRALHNLGLLLIESVKPTLNPNQKREKLLAAKIWFEKALSVNPKMTQALSSLGGVAFSLGEKEQAKSYYLRALALQPEHLVSNVRMGNISLLENNFFQAELYYQKAFQYRAQEETLKHYCFGLLFSQWSKTEPKKFALAEKHLLLVKEKHSKAKSELLNLYSSRWNYLYRNQQILLSAKKELKTLAAKLVALLEELSPSSTKISQLKHWLKTQE